MEKDVEKRLVTKIKALGGKAYKFVSPGNDGVPDRLVVLPGGRTVFVELKTEIGRTSKMQDYQISELRRMGAEVRVLHGDTEVNDFVREMEG